MLYQLKNAKPAHAVVALALLTTGVPALLTGCSSSGVKLGQGAEAAQGLNDSAELIRAGKEQVSATIASMNSLREMTGGTLPELFAGFSKQMDDLESIADRVASTNDRMRREGKKYFDKWESSIASINNEDIKARSEERKASIQKSLDKVAKSYESMSEQYAELMTDLQDIRTALQTDLTGEGVKSLSRVMKRASGKGDAVIKAAERAATAYEELGLKMSATAG